MATLTPLPLRRRDSLPENHDYVDDGCEVAPSCLGCPLAVCRYDMPQGMQSLRGEQRGRQAVQLWMQGVRIPQIAKQLGMSERTIYRHLQQRRST